MPLQTWPKQGLAALMLCSLAACSAPAPWKKAAPTPPRFHAPLPQGEAAVVGWWAQFDDPVVRQLVDAALASDPGLAQAQARIGQARALLAGSGAAGWPQLDLQASAARGTLALAGDAVGLTIGRGLDASWEIDLFGALRQASAAAHARLDARTADLSAAQVSLAAEVALALVQYRACLAAALVLTQDLASREQSARLTGLKVEHGLSAPGDASLSAASSADARQRMAQQQADCQLALKALVALSALPEESLQARLGASRHLPRPRAIAVAAVPAQVLAQRPDIAAAERELAAAAADVGAADAQRYPRLSLLGSIGVAGVRLDGQRDTRQAWSFGPSLSLPIFDGGRARAGVELARARYDEAHGRYRQAVVAAVRGTEEALVRLDAARRRDGDAALAAHEYEQVFRMGEQRFQAGSVSLFELEELRRNMLAARLTAITVERDQVAAWIALYKALGGGWSASSAIQSSLESGTHPTL